MLSTRNKPAMFALVNMSIGGLVTYGIFVGLGYLPLWFGLFFPRSNLCLLNKLTGPEVRAWNRKYWDSQAQELLDSLANDVEFELYKPRESTRNFLMTGPHPDSNSSRRVRRVLYFNRTLKILVGVVHFGADCEGPPRCVHGGCTAATVDAILGVAAYRTARMPCVTASLTVNYRDKIPLGSQCGIHVTQIHVEGRRKSKFAFKLYSLVDPEKVYADGEALFVNALIPSGKNGALPPFLNFKN